MTKLVNRAKMTTATTGTGTITLGSAVDGFQTFANAGVANADVVRYVIEDGDAWEIGLGTFDSAAGTLTRSPSESSIGGGAITLSGEAVVFVSAAAGELQELVDFADNFVLPTADGTTGQVLTTNGAGALTFEDAGGGGAGLGDGQTWQSVSRASGVIYQNTTGKPIALAYSLGSGSFAGTPDLQVGTAANLSGAPIVGFSQGGFASPNFDDVLINLTFFAVVPDGHYYQVNYSSFQYLSELR